MPAILVKLAQWFIGLFGAHIVGALKDYISRKLEEKRRREEMKREIADQVARLKEAKTNDEFNKASRDLLDKF